MERHQIQLKIKHDNVQDLFPLWSSTKHQDKTLRVCDNQIRYGLDVYKQMFSILFKVNLRVAVFLIN